MPQIDFPRIRHATTAHQSGGSDAVLPEGSGIAGTPTLRLIDQTNTFVAAGQTGLLVTFSPTRTGQRWIPLFLRGTATNPAGGNIMSVRYRFTSTDTAANYFADTNTSGNAGGTTVLLHMDWAAATAVGVQTSWNTVETAANFYSNMTVTDLGGQTMNGFAVTTIEVRANNSGNANSTLRTQLLVMEY